MMSAALDNDRQTMIGENPAVTKTVSLYPFRKLSLLISYSLISEKIYLN